MVSDLSVSQHTQLLETAIQAAQAAAIPIQAYFDQENIYIDKKSDGSPVTRADREAEEVIRTHLLEKSVVGPFDILGEEAGLKGSGTRWRWIVDPIDGTRSFVHGIPLFGTIIALLDTQENIPVIGVIHLPMLGVTCAAAKGQGTRYQGHIVRLDEKLELGDVIIGAGDIVQFRDTKRDADLQVLQGLSGYVRAYTDCFGHSLVINGSLGAMLDPGLNPWDILATQVLIEETGGRIELRTSSLPNKVDALFGNCSIVDTIAREIGF